MRIIPMFVGLLILVSATSMSYCQSTFSFNIRPGGVDAPVFDAQGVPLAGSNYLVELYGGIDSTSLSPTTDYYTGMRVMPRFLTGIYAGYWQGNNASMTVWTPIAGMPSWLQVRAWDFRLGATYEEVVASGLGGYGESHAFYADGANPTIFQAPAPLIGLQSFSLRAVVPEPSALILAALGIACFSRWSWKRLD